MLRTFGDIHGHYKVRAGKVLLPADNFVHVLGDKAADRPRPGAHPGNTAGKEGEKESGKEMFKRVILQE